MYAAIVAAAGTIDRHDFGDLALAYHMHRMHLVRDPVRSAVGMPHSEGGYLAVEGTNPP
jgi:hypothetical protein